ncbi:hypothetical protein ENKNEFLB_03635 [Nocardioides aquaticus]|uniref:Uncharacterized protein n=1 Tax=Nocardioides aquaticus TaxID=160826 RepID=A0ABX8EPK4_9ACTN|nr:hypothetical protein [Nocardioides aquaticus]QVT81227.1 hypothetical protein ENKNEFLB_03635 [Nocardioides aquaticus]
MTVLPLHLGALHPVEQALTLLLAFGPFLLLGVVIAVRRRQDAAEDVDEGAADGVPEDVRAQRER